MTAKKVRTIFVIEPELKERAEKLAKEQGLSFSALIRKLLVNYLEGDLTIEEEIAEIKKRLDALEQQSKK